MLEMARLVGTPPGKIILQTREGKDVENSQSCPPDGTIMARYALLRRMHSGWINRKPACGIYNCFGLVWASRRTAVYDEGAISQILKDDGYRQLLPGGTPQPGDIVLYRNSNSTMHAAIVMELRQLQPDGSMIPWVLSKWGNVFGEDFHAIQNIPKDLEGCIIEFWTDRL
jgi:hypothetical protein